MAIGVDTSKWKPRKVKGTPAAKFRNYFAIGILSFGMVCGALFHHSSQVTSKYFGNPMDESLSDFQEKKTIKGPKEPKQPAKLATRKPKKRICGQKDIRTALRPKKNELITYANDFDKVCKKSGLDIDSEQLQLAIALSKSLQKDNNDDQSSTSVSAKDRTGKIRKTLQEYGFKVPVLKSLKSTKRRVKKYRKDYKLILSTEEEKRQIISDRYTQVLFRNIEREKNVEAVQNSEVNLYQIGTQMPYEVIRSDKLFYVEDLIEHNSNSVGSLLKSWSEIPGRPVSPIPETFDVNFYECECLQDKLDSILSGALITAQDIVKTLKKVYIEQHSQSQKDSLKKMDTVNIIMLDDKDDTEANEKQTIISNSLNVIDGPNSTLVANVARSCSPDIFDDEISSIMEKTKENSIFTSQEPPKNITDASNNVMNLTECVGLSQRNANLHISKSFQTNSQLSRSNVSKRRSNDLMEITECVAGSSQPLLENIVEEHIDLTHNSDTNSDKIIIDYVINKDYTIKIIPVEPTEVIDAIDGTNKTLPKENNNEDIVSLDLTQSSHSEDELPMIQISGRDISNKDTSFDDTIILNEEEYKGLSTEPKNIAAENKIVNSSIEDNICVIEIQNSPNLSQDKAVNDSVVSDIQKTSFLITENKSQIETSPLENIKIMTEKESLLSSTSNLTSERGSKSKSESFFDEFVYPHSDEDDRGNSKGDSEPKGSSTNDSHNLSIIDLNDNSNESDKHVINQIISNDIDLTQSSNSSTADEKYFSNGSGLDNVRSPQVSYDSVGKKDDVSIDYDEIFDDVVKHHSVHEKQSTSSKSAIDNNVDSSKSANDKVNSEKNKLFERSNSILSSCSQNSEVFEISDNELNYSINQSKFETPIDNFDFGGISVMDELSIARGSKSTRISEELSNSLLRNPTHCDTRQNDTNQRIDDSFLPLVNIGSSNSTAKCIQKDISLTALDISTASTAKYSFTPSSLLTKENISIETPSNREYVIKTNQVTPMLDYDAMTTPERNKELNKYGLKPFKRKRAVQLLTHLYNQTHPIIESCSRETLHSPSKKRKTNNTPHTDKSPRKSPRKRHSPSKKQTENKIKSPRKPDNFLRVEDENMYEATNENPVIKHLECSKEDWVFQKKEKAKLHSCRVPLHIAFHNYVSARPALRDAMLRYEPVNIDDIHKGLLANGLRFDPKDLLRFMDKKCITVKTADNTNKKN